MGYSEEYRAREIGEVVSLEIDERITHIVDESCAVRADINQLLHDLLEEVKPERERDAEHIIDKAMQTGRNICITEMEAKIKGLGL